MINNPQTMKRILLMALMAVMTSVASAQLWMSGSVELSVDNYDEYNQEGTFQRNTSFRFSPKLGYDLNTHWSVGLSMSYSHQQTKQDNTNYVNGSSNVHINYYEFGPFVRYYVNESRLRFFVDGNPYYTINHQQGASYSNHAIGLSLLPGLSYALTDRIGLTANFGAFSWHYGFYDNDEHNGRTSQVSFHLANSIGLGLYFYLR